MKKAILVANKCVICNGGGPTAKLSVHRPYLCMFCPLDDSYELNALRQLNVNNYT